MLSLVYSARAGLEKARGHGQDAVDLGRTALRLKYTRPVPRDIAASHYNQATYLSRTRANPREQRAHRLAAALLAHLVGDTHTLTQTLHALAGELRGETGIPDAPALPTTLPDVIGLVDAGEGVHFGQLVAALCPDPDTASNALAELLTTAATLPDQPAENTIERVLANWDPLITAVATAVTNGHIPAELIDALDELGANTDWVALVTALRQVLAGARDRVQLLAGLDDIDIAILTTVLERLPISPAQHRC
jgi:hypothetical protein